MIKYKKAVFSGQAKYYYYQRNDSIVNSTFNYHKIVMLDYCQNIINFSKGAGEIYDKEAYAFYLQSLLMLIMNVYNSLNNKNIEEAGEILKIKIKKYIFLIHILKKKKIVLLQF